MKKTIIALLLLIVSLNANYLGCFNDKGDEFTLKNRDLNGYFIFTSDMDINECISLCKQKGFKYAGLQFHYKCYCGNSYGKYKKSTKCNTTCVGNSKEICGGEFANSVYSTNNKKHAQNIEFGVDRPGSDYKSFNLKQNNFLLCKDACDADENCKAWTYVKPGVQGPTARCWLKYNVPKSRVNPNTISGVKKVENK